jgi:hypothetical protein
MFKMVTRIILAAVASLGAESLIMSAAQAVEVIPSLELRVNRLNGVTRVITAGTPATGGDTNGTADWDNYTIASNTASNVWVPGNWTSLTSQDGGGWEEVPVGGTTTQLTELNLTGFKPVSFGDVISLGNAYDIGTGEDISFTYGLDGNATAVSGTVVFEGVNVPPTLELHVNRFTGETRIVGTGGATDPADQNVPADLDNYTIASNSANLPLENVWIPGNWTSLTSQDGGGWEEVPVGGTTTQLTELNLTGFKPVSTGDEIALGTVYNITDTEKDITFLYGLDGDNTTIAGNVVFDGVGLRLRVNKTTGKVEIVNGETAGVDFNGYVIQSVSGDLNVTTWNSLEDQAVPGWGETNSTSFAISELNLASSSVLASAGSFDLGAAYQGGVGGTEDMSFDYNLSGVGPVSGVVEYVIAGDGDFDLDGDVDGNDFLVWQRTDGTPGGLTLWQTNYGTGVLAAAGAASVPEPAGAVLMLLAALTGTLTGRRRRKVQFSRQSQ